MIAINLNQPISCEKLCHQIQNLITKNQQTNTENKELILVIDIKSISYTTYPDLPKLEYKAQV
jgi:hypothetical protein